MRLFQKVPDGGKGSGVTAFVLIEIKSLFSIMLLHFAPGSREKYHNHAFNAWTLWLKGTVTEIDLHGPLHWFKAGQWKYTPRTCFHKVIARPGGAWALTFRGPWRNWWQEFGYNPKTNRQEYTYLTHGRKEYK